MIDETYRDFINPDMAAPHSLFGVPGWGRTLIQLYSFSKSFCIPGHRLGWSPRRGCGRPGRQGDGQPADLRAATGPDRGGQGLPALADWRVENTREIARRAAAFSRALGEANDWSIEAMGAYFVYLRHPFPGHRSREVAEALAREAGIICLPGAFFGKNQDPYLRIAFANAGMETMDLLGARLRVPFDL